MRSWFSWLRFTLKTGPRPRSKRRSFSSGGQESLGLPHTIPAGHVPCLVSLRPVTPSAAQAGTSEQSHAAELGVHQGMKITENSPKLWMDLC